MCLPTHEKILRTSMCSRFLSFMHLLERELRVSMFISPKHIYSKKVHHQYLGYIRWYN
jgi:hypothetical protein